MSTITVNGQRAISASITIPLYGAWTADVTLAVDVALANPITLVVGDLTMTGAIVRTLGSAGARSMRLVGGTGGWRNSIPARGYGQPQGIKLSTVLSDAARECGESIAVPSSVDHVIGANYGREEAPAERTLHLLTDGAWYVDPSGTTQITSRNSSAIATPFTAVKWSGGMGRFEIATETISDWQPGRTFSSVVFTGTQTISGVNITADNDGKLRLVVLTTTSGAERFRGDLRDMIRQEIATLTYASTWEYRVAASLGLGVSTLIDATPTNSAMPTLSKVPLAAGVGVVAPPIAGTTCRIRFVNADPTRPEVVSLGATTEHLMTIEACALLIYNSWVAICSTAAAGPLTAVIIQPLLGAAVTAALAAQAAPAPPGLIAQLAAAATFQAGFASGVTPSPAMFAAWTAAIAALSTKTLNVSGSFPSIGIPNQ